MRVKLKVASKAILVLLVVSLSVSACVTSKSNQSVDSDSLAAAATIEDSSGLRAAAKLIAQGILDADGDLVFAQIPKNCQAKLSRSEVSKQLRSVRAYLTTFVGASLEDFSITKVETRKVKKAAIGQARYTIEVKGKSREALAKTLEKDDEPQQTLGGSSTTRARPTISFDEPTEWFDFVYESSTWKLESCQEFLESAGIFTSRSDPTNPTNPTNPTS